jgi:hypothetical protein
MNSIFHELEAFPKRNYSGRDTGKGKNYPVSRRCVIITQDMGHPAPGFPIE